MAFTIKDIANELNLQFYTGNNYQLKELMFFNDNEFYNFAGNRKGIPQFLKKAQSLYPDICANKLHNDYCINRRLVMASYYMIRDYHRQTRLYPNMEFKYEESLVPETQEYSRQFEILNGVVLPISSPFWNLYLPPNYVEDSCFVRISDKDTTSIPEHLPAINNRFIANRHVLFFDKYPFNEGWSR